MHAVGAVLQPESSFQYPPAEASQEEVTNNPELFHATLKKVPDMHADHEARLAEVNISNTHKITLVCATLHATYVSRKAQSSLPE